MRFKNFVIQLFLILPLYSHNKTYVEIDSILNESFQKFTELQFIESSNLANNALELSISSNYSKGRVMSNLYIAKVLLEIGMNLEAFNYIQNINEESYFKETIIPQVEYHRLKGRVYGSQQIYTLAKEEFNKQLSLSEQISDQKKKELSKLWAYQNIEHLYALQGINDSIVAYQNLQAQQLSYFEEHEVFYNIGALYRNKGELYLKKEKFDEAAVQLQKSFAILEKYDTPYKYNILQAFGDLEAGRGNIEKAISYYYDALNNSISLNANQTTCELHKKLADYMLKNDTLIDNARDHGKMYALLNDSLQRHNSMVVNTVLENIMNENKRTSAQHVVLFWHIVISLVFISILLAAFLIARNRRNKKSLSEKIRMIGTKEQKIEFLEEELESNIFQDIIELAKSNSPEFLPLFGEGYPEFIEAMKQLDPNIRSSELYFCALAYLNFSTKDIANFTFVTVRAVQVRKNRMRKKYDIPSEVDFNEWFRNLENRGVFIYETS